MCTWCAPVWHAIHWFCCHAAHPALDECLFVLSEFLPCESCTIHMRNYLEQHPIDAQTDALDWSIEFHNDVNRRLHKSEMDLKQARQMYKDGEKTEKDRIRATTALLQLIPMYQKRVKSHAAWIALFQQHLDTWSKSIKK
jgi:hypothetical protein